MKNFIIMFLSFTVLIFLTACSPIEMIRYDGNIYIQNAQELSSWTMIEKNNDEKIHFDWRMKENNNEKVNFDVHPINIINSIFGNIYTLKHDKDNIFLIYSNFINDELWVRKDIDIKNFKYKLENIDKIMINWFYDAELEDEYKRDNTIITDKKNIKMILKYLKEIQKGHIKKYIVNPRDVNNDILLYGAEIEIFYKNFPATYTTEYIYKIKNNKWVYEYMDDNGWKKVYYVPDEITNKYLENK